MSGSLEFADATSALEHWKNFDLSARRVSLEASTKEIREAKMVSISGRKRLQELTKQFRSADKEEQVATALEVVKAYQEEIDQLSGRSKLCEKAFYELYKDIYEAPDPVNAIDGLIKMVSSGSTHALEIEKLNGEISQYEEEFQKLKNQDVTIRRLEERLAEYDTNAEDKVEEIVASKVTEAEAIMQEKITEAEEALRASERRLAGAVESTKHAQESADRAQSELFEVSSQAEGRVSALMSENSILIEGAERTRARISELESDLAAVQKASSGATDTENNTDDASGGGGMLSMERSHEKERKALQQKISELHAELRNVEETNRVSKSFLEKSVSELQKQTSAEKSTSQALRRELEGRPTKEDVASLKQQLWTIQKVVFNVNDDDGDEDEDEDKNGGGSEHKGGMGGASLDTKILTRLKALETDLLNARNKLAEVSRSESAAVTKVRVLEDKLSKSEGLVAQLEADLAMTSGGGEGAEKDGGGAGAGTTGSATERKKRNKITGELELSELLGVDAGSIPTVKARSNGTLAEARQAAESSGQMVNILRGQRDRYKERLSQAETNLSTLQGQLSLSQAKTAQLEQDNLALYGKLRYLQSKGGVGIPAHLSPPPKAKGMALTMGGGGGGDRGGYDLEDGVGGGGGGSADDVETKYGNLYENKMNPFAQFSDDERRARIGELSVGDQVVFTTLQAFLSTPTRRNALLVYMGCMHVIVLFFIYWCTHHQSHVHGCDPTLDHHVHKTLLGQQLES